ncbi:MAG: cardiolipin synthase [Clostridiales bacterium]|nr:cardiolipin synthase [Clostridiales bacterium]
MKRYLKIFFSRFFFIGLTIIVLFIVDVVVVVGGVHLLTEVLYAYFPTAGAWARWALQMLEWLILIVTVLHIVNRDMLPETKIPWLLCVVGLNVFGVAIYVVFSHNRPSRRQRRKYLQIYEFSRKFIEESPEKCSNLGDWADVSYSLNRQSSDAVLYTNTKTQYLKSGEVFFESLVNDLKRAEKYIFLEYFIIARGKMWYTILDILKERAKAGVDIRVIYDDIGCMGKIRAGYYKELRKAGIKCVKFNPFVPVVTNVHNFRDHRKIAVIDGKIGYTGGINLADEYINETHPFGQWKDTAVRLEGEGVRGLILMFLQLYNLRSKETEEFAPYMNETYETFEGEGYVQPYGDGPRPLYGSQIGEETYINVLNTAKKYVYITTPYLIIDYRMRSAIVSAALRGVDVRIIVPHIPDKKIPFALTRSNYSALMKAGVKIYEYTPGFIHAKSFVADDEVGIVGTINLDYRSLLHHFENAVFMYKTKAVMELKADVEETFEVSALQTAEGTKKNIFWRAICEIAKVFAPLF